MRLTPTILTPGLFAIAALLSLFGARVAVTAIESISADSVRDELVLQGYEWSQVQADGLKVVVSGTAPSETDRFRAISAAGTVVDAARVIDNMQVPAAEAIQPPKFSLEILRNDSGISLIGLIPADSDRDGLNAEIKGIAGRGSVTDLMGVADHPVPKNWEEALEFAVTALETLPRAKISMDANRVSITAVADSIEQKTTWERALKRAAPRNLLLLMDISAPRPVITPFTLRFIIDEQGPRFDACSAHDTVGRAKIVSAAVRAGLISGTECTIGLGVPSADWPEAVQAGIDAVAKLEGGSITFSDADVTLVAPAGTAQSEFDRVVGELEADLPSLYSLHSVLPEVVKIDGSGEGDGPPEFVATLSPEGQVQLRGRLTDDIQRAATESVARAQFGVGAVYAATRLDPELPAGWPTRVLAGLEALGHLNNGAVVVQPDVVVVRGNTGDPDASATISRILAEKLGASQNYQVNVVYKEALDPVLGLPTPQECVAEINLMLAESKITFAPGSANIEASAADTLDKIAELLKTCGDVRMEIAGYTDSQGREEMNRNLSQSRAQAVLTALLARRVLTSNLAAKGYGEEDPIAGNDTEEGREANRRIEFHLLEAPAGDQADAPADPVAEPVAQDRGEGADDRPAEGQDPPGDAPADATQPDDSADAAAGTAPAPDAADDADPTGVVAQTPEDDDPRPAPRPEGSDGDTSNSDASQ
ncbi:OmpA family protein [Aliiroseovarius crassostreae]|uniref:OmpA family protein n=1 Tax=Aliiroseovarius crassostreae TaxID=154981 RepID=UPI003C7AF044